jgi:hypothetical protein
MIKWLIKLLNISDDISEQERLEGINCREINLTKYINPMDGFTVKESGQIISWDETFLNIENDQNVSVEIDEYNSKFLVFRDTIIIGSLQIYNFKIRYPDLRFNRNDVPMESIWNEIKLVNASGFENYFEVKRVLVSTLGTPSPCYERADSKTSHWGKNGINISISCRENSKLHLHIENNRDYSFLIPKFELPIKNPNTIKFNKKGFYIPSKDFRKPTNLYKTSENIRELFEKDTVSIIWVDKESDILGFSDNNYCSIFDLKELKSLKLQNELPAKGGGGSYLFIEYLESTNKVGSTIMTELYLFDKYVDALKKMFGDKFFILEQTYNA